GIPYISKDIKKRFSHIAKELATGKYDVVSLQEVWSQTDYQYICTVVADVLPYTVYFYSGVIGSGVCVFSKYPITDTYTYRFSVNGYMHMVHHGDWFGGKSVGYCLIEHPKQQLHFFTTHLIAEYNRQNDKYLAHRTVQAFQLSEFINHLTKPSDYVIVCGDMNSEPVDTCYRVIKDLPCLNDAWKQVRQKASLKYSNYWISVEDLKGTQKEVLTEIMDIIQDGLNNTSRIKPASYLMITALLVFMFLPLTMECV
ncbi:hypothetical protein QZH41_016441, partial [Actinostola sp. cb2023]